MKTNLIPHFILIFFICSCEVLDQEPESKISTEQAFSTEENAQNAVNGLYNEIQSIYDWRTQAISDIASDVIQSVDTWDAFNNIDEYRVTSHNSEVEDFYTILYRAIDISNNIISEVPKLNLPVERENDLLGQAYCIRGMMYFELVRFWGGIPNVYGELGVVIRTTPSKGINAESFGSRATLQETYDRVQFDLEQAIELLPETRGDNFLDRSRVVKATTRAFLSRFHLYLKNFDRVERYSTEVIEDSRYGLVTPYDNIFREKNTEESIFEMQYSINDISGLRNWYFPASLGGRGGLAFHDAFFHELTANENDDRSKMVAFNDNAGVYYPTKYYLPGNADNTHVIRVAEMYLNRAESRAEMQNIEGAKQDLNKIRNRSGLENSSAESKEELLAAIMKERKFEFYAEGHRWFDLTRTGQATTILRELQRKNGSQPVSLDNPARQVFPFPTSELLSNPNLVQNIAYE